jgi:hypothetical protein
MSGENDPAKMIGQRIPWRKLPLKRAVWRGNPTGSQLDTTADFKDCATARFLA